MVEFFIQDYSETDVFIYVSPDVNYSWYRIYVRETVSGAEVFSSWFNYTVGFSWSVDGLRPGTSYTVNVQYNNTGQGGGGSWAGAKSFTTLGAVQETRYAVLVYSANGGAGLRGRSTVKARTNISDLPSAIPRQPGRAMYSRAGLWTRRPPAQATGLGAVSLSGPPPPTQGLPRPCMRCGARTRAAEHISARPTPPSISLMMDG